MVLPYLTANGGVTGTGLDISYIDVVINSTVTGRLDIYAYGASGATSYKYRYALQSGDLNTAIDTTSTPSAFSITGLTPGQTYKVMVRAYNGATFGNAIIKENIYIPVATPIATLPQTIVPDITAESALSTWSATPYQNLSLTSTQSLYSITNTSTVASSFKVSYKQFTEIPTAETWPSDISVGYNPTYPESGYAFGTTMILDATKDIPNQVGGIGFFVKDLGTTGYFLRIQASSSGYSGTSQKDVTLVKVLNSDIIPIAGADKIDFSSLAGSDAGETYKVDIKVKSITTGPTPSNEITIYVNGFSISITDSSRALSPTNTVAMYAGKGTVNFDYIYGMGISRKEYLSSTLYNTYTGQFSDNHLEFLFGDKVFNNTTLTNPVKGRTEEFGSVARELRKFSFKYPDRPAFPIAPTTGISNKIKVMGSRLTNFGAEAYVLNNSGFSLPLSDDTEATFMVYGYSISKSGELQYDNFDKNLYASEEPVIFNTRWLQNESDVKKLADWLKTQWAKKQSLIELNVFGNPLIQIGDVIKIDYPYHGLTTSQKFLVLGVNHSYNGGLDTSITCRTI